MSILEMIIFLVFIFMNSIFSFYYGQRSGKWDGIVGTMRFLKEQKCLKPKSSVKEFKHWPEFLQHVYTNPEEIE